VNAYQIRGLSGESRLACRFFLPSPGSTTRTDAEEWRLSDVLLLALWLAGAAVALALKHSQLFIGLDGGYMRELARRQFEWGVPLLSTSIDFYQGIGDIFFSGLNFTLIPSFVAGSWFGTGAGAKVVTYTVALAEYTLSMVAFARTLGTTRNQALAAALGLPLLTFPLYRSGAIYPVLALVPQLATYTAATLLVCVALLRFGCRSVVRDLPYAALFFGTMVWLVHTGVMGMVLAGPMLALTFFSGLFAARDWRERLAKSGLVILTAALLVGATIYLLGLLFDTAPITAPTELANDRAVLMFASILFHWKQFGPAGPLLVIAAVFGALLASFDRSRPILRIFGITLLTYLFTRLSFWFATVLFDFWRGPSALYFEFFAYPLYAIFAVLLITRITELIPIRLPGWLSGHRCRPIMIGTAVVLALIFAYTTPSAPYGFAYPPAPTPSTPPLQSQLELIPPAPFRGRVATLTGRTFDRGINWFDLHGVDGDIEQHFGNEMRIVGLHYFGIPGFFQYGPTMTPAFYTATSRLLADPRDRQMRSVSVLRRYEPKLLAMFGIRYVVTDAPIVGAELASRVESGDRALYLYIVPRPNVGNYSPTAVREVMTATDVLVRMARPDFDPVRELVATVPGGANDLVAARDGRIVFDGVSVAVTAQSERRSVLLLPLEFSRCLTVTARSGHPILFRANLLLLGVVFDGRLDASIQLRTGPFVNPSCRLRDLQDLLAFGIRDVPPDVRSGRS